MIDNMKRSINLIQSYSETEKQVEEEMDDETFKITIVD